MAIFDCATWRPIGANVGGAMGGQRGLVLHHQAGDGSLYGFFSNPSAEVSAHFWVGKDGAVEQYVDSERVAWHGMALNGEWCGVETEGCGGGDEPLTDEQVDGLAAIFAEGHARHGWPFELAESIDGRGFGYHRMEVATACPCDLRLAARPTILEKASGAPVAPGPSEPSSPAPSPGGPAPPWPGRVIVERTLGDDVEVWQGQMRARGWRLAVDGDYWHESADVCEAFQREKGLEVDRAVGPETWAAAWTAPVT